jgi:hypothetical protein
MNFPLSLPILAGLGITAMAGVYIMNKNDNDDEVDNGGYDDVKQKKNKKKKVDSDDEQESDDDDSDDRGFGFSFFGNSLSGDVDDDEAGTVKKRKYNKKIPLQKTNRARKSYTTTKKNR